MEDRFKFRVWSRRFNEMKYIKDDCDDFVTGDGRVFIGRCEVSKPILMQCTGLSDKNGDLIYEGDIVLWESEKYVEEDYHKGIVIGCVSWNYICGNICYECDGGFRGYGFTVDVLGTDHTCMTEFVTALHSGECEIIGNKFEDEYFLKWGLYSDKE